MIHIKDDPLNYYKVAVQYLQKSDVLVAAESPENAAELVSSQVVEGTEQFSVLGVSELNDEEKVWLTRQMMGLPEEIEEKEVLN